MTGLLATVKEWAAALFKAGGMRNIWSAVLLGLLVLVVLGFGLWVFGVDVAGLFG